MKATTFFNKDEKTPESGGEAVIKSGKLYILTDSGVIVKQRVALRQSQSKQDQKLNTKLHHIAKTEQTLLPSFYVDDDEYVLYAKTGVISQYPLHLREIQSVFWDLRNAIKALHDEGVAHLDIKPSNIVLRDNGLPALIDYGCSGFLNDKTVGDTTLLYAPPEYFGDQKKYNREAHDIWSMAMSILELAVPEQFSKFKNKIPSNLLGQAAFFEKFYSQENLSTTLHSRNIFPDPDDFDLSIPFEFHFHFLSGVSHNSYYKASLWYSVSRIRIIEVFSLIDPFLNK